MNRRLFLKCLAGLVLGSKVVKAEEPKVLGFMMPIKDIRIKNNYPNTLFFNPHIKTNEVLGLKNKTKNLFYSISYGGIREPLFVSRLGYLLDGRKRLDAAKKLGHTHVPVIAVSLDHVKKFHDQQLFYKGMPNEQAIISEEHRRLRSGFYSGQGRGTLDDGRGRYHRLALPSS